MCCTPDDVFLVFEDFDGKFYKNKILKGLRYRLIRDKSALLEPDLDYITAVNSFEIISFIMQPDTTIQIQFY